MPATSGSASGPGASALNSCASPTLMTVAAANGCYDKFRINLGVVLPVAISDSRVRTPCKSSPFELSSSPLCFQHHS